MSDLSASRRGVDAAIAETQAVLARFLASMDSDSIVSLDSSTSSQPSHPPPPPVPSSATEQPPNPNSVPGLPNPSPTFTKSEHLLPNSFPPINFTDLQKFQSNEKSPSDFALSQPTSQLQNPNSEIPQLTSPPPIPKSPRPPPSTMQSSLPRSEHPWPPSPSRFQPLLPQTPPPPIPPQPTEPPPPDTLPLPATLPPKFPPPYSSLQIFSDPPCSSLSTVANPIAEVPLPTPQLQPSLFQTPPLPVKELSSTEIDEQRERMLCDGADQKFYIFVDCHGDSFWPIDTKDWRESDSLERILRLQVSFIPPSPQVMLGGEPPPILSLIWNQQHKVIWSPYTLEVCPIRYDPEPGSYHGPTYHAHPTGTARVDVIGVRCYSSKNLWAWKFEGVVLAAEQTDAAHDLYKLNVLERPKVMYNEKTHKYTMWMHIDDAKYSKASVGVAVSDSPTGPFSYLHSFMPNGFDSRDMTVFKDDDGAGYLIYASLHNKEIHITPLTRDFLNVTGRALIGMHREAPAVFKHGGVYYMVTSGCSGWLPNEALVHEAESMLGPWETIGNPCVGGNKAYRAATFFAQGSFVLPMPHGGGGGGGRGEFIFMADRWNAGDLRDSRYMWLPLTVKARSSERYTPFPLWSKVAIFWHERWRTPIKENGETYYVAKPPQFGDDDL